MRETDRRQGRGQGREDSYLLTVCPCLCELYVCACLHARTVCFAAKHWSCSGTQKIHSNLGYKKNKMWQIGAGGSFRGAQSLSSSLNHFLSLLQFVWSVKYSVKVLFKGRSQATHFSYFDSNLRIIYISSVSCFMTETTVTVGSFFPFSHFMNNVPFVLRLLCYYLFMKISRGYWTVVIFYVPLSFFLSCSLYLLFSLLPNLANLPSE